MGWPWPFVSTGSQKPHDNDTTAPPTSDTSSIALSDEQRMRIFGRPSNSTSSSPQPSRDQQADSELDALIKSFQEDQSTSQTQDPNSHQTQPPPSSVPSRHLASGDLDISPSALYPRTMSCRQHFDQAFYCQSLGGKFNDIYRYGQLKSCSEQWGAFWFCMRTRTLPAAEKEERIREFYRDKEEKKLEGGSSEDVWEIRKVGIKRAFDRNPDDEGEDISLVRE